MKLVHLLVLVLFSLSVNADVIDPVDDEDLGYFQLMAPTDAPVETGGIVAGTASYTVRSDKNLRIQPGTYCLALQTLWGGHTPICNQQVAPRQAVLFPVLQHLATLDWNSSSNMFDIGFGKNLFLVANSPGKRALEFQVGPGVGWISPGDYTFEVWNPSRSAKLVNDVRKVAAGNRERVDFTPPTDLRTYLSFLAPQRSFGDFVTRCFANPIFLIDRSNPRSIGTADVLFEPYPQDVMQTERDLGPHKWDQLWRKSVIYNSKILGITGYRRITQYGQPVAFFADGIKPEISVNNIPYQGTLNPGRTEIQLKRIDVNHVTVTREDGTTYIVNGKYSAFYKDTKGLWKQIWVTAGCLEGSYSPLTSFPTKTGLDVPPAEYKVTVSFTTEEGLQQKDYFLDLR